MKAMLVGCDKKNVDLIHALVNGDERALLVVIRGCGGGGTDAGCARDIGRLGGRLGSKSRNCHRDPDTPTNELRVLHAR